jgi:phage/plasmid-like protein (TIGR03299 family)
MQRSKGMSTETIEVLNTLQLIGFTSLRGRAWHYRAEAQGEEPNHYDGEIPVDDVRRRLLNWTAEERVLYTLVPAETWSTATTLGADGEALRYAEVDGRKAIVRSDTGATLGIFKSGYTVHQYQDALLGNVANLLDDGLSIGSAGLLRGGAIAYVSVEMDENVHTEVGMEFRPFLLATTSHDGSLATTYKRVTTRVVCDNTCEAALGEKGEAVKVRHSRYSALRISSAREALGILSSLTDDTVAEIERLAAWDVSNRDFGRWLDRIVPVDVDASDAVKARLGRQRDEMTAFYHGDPRVAPWAGTALGVQQLVNTWRQHRRPARKGQRVERNMLDLLTGRTGDKDRSALDHLRLVTA